MNERHPAKAIFALANLFANFRALNDGTNQN